MTFLNSRWLRTHSRTSTSKGRRQISLTALPRGITERLKGTKPWRTRARPSGSMSAYGRNWRREAARSWFMIRCRTRGLARSTWYLQRWRSSNQIRCLLCRILNRSILFQSLSEVARRRAHESKSSTLRIQTLSTVQTSKFLTAAAHLLVTTNLSQATTGKGSSRLCKICNKTCTPISPESDRTRWKASMQTTGTPIPRKRCTLTTTTFCHSVIPAT